MFCKKDVCLFYMDFTLFSTGIVVLPIQLDSQKELLKENRPKKSSSLVEAAFVHKIEERFAGGF